MIFTWIRSFVQLLSLFFACAASAYAQQTDLNTFNPALACVTASARDVHGHPVSFAYYPFPDGSQGLAIAVFLPDGAPDPDIKRVTFGSNSTATCPYKSLAIAPGGEWGWHLVWMMEGAATLSYARMDGVAWVSSPTKKLSKNARIIGQPAILTFEQKVWVVWHETDDGLNKVYAVYSDDEGRNWQEAKLLLQTSNVIGNLRLDVKENQPYLVWGGDTAVSLQGW